MPGCKPGDRAVVIDRYHTGPNNVGSFHKVMEPCACMAAWWLLHAEAPCTGVLAVNGPLAMLGDIPCGGGHCAPDRCLQPIRPKGDELALPAPSKELEHA